MTRKEQLEELRPLKQALKGVNDKSTIQELEIAKQNALDAALDLIKRNLSRP